MDNRKQDAGYSYGNLFAAVSETVRRPYTVMIVRGHSCVWHGMDLRLWLGLAFGNCTMAYWLRVGILQYCKITINDSEFSSNNAS